MHITGNTRRARFHEIQREYVLAETSIARACVSNASIRGGAISPDIPLGQPTGANGLFSRGRPGVWR